MQPDLTKAEDAELAEGTAFEVFDVPALEHSGFTHFLDGAERKWRAGYYGLYPLTLAHTSAALLRREDRKVHAPEAGRYLGQGLRVYAPEPCAAKVQATGLAIQVVHIEEGDTPAIVEKKTRELIQDERERHEVDLARHFADEGWLLVDGGIGKAIEQNRRLTQIVGIVKTHTKQYFSRPDSVMKVLGMRPGQRTSLFKRKHDSKQGAEVLSCYLKLRDSAAYGPLYGLIRVEIPELESAKGRIDEIAGWILAERAPLSKPDPRFDRLLYPIRLVEEHLKARQPSDAAIAGIIG